MYRILLTKTAEKDLETIDQRYRKPIENRFKELAVNPLLGKKLKNSLREFRSLREGVYRIIYKIENTELTIYIVAIDHRQSV